MSNPFATLILTRPDAANAAFLRDFGPWPEGLDIVRSPMLEIVATGLTPDAAGFEGVIFTSKNGVAFAGVAQQLPAYCVGEATTQAARAAGWDAQMVGDGSDALVKGLIKANVRGPLLHIGGVHRRGEVAARLTQTGLTTRNIDVYDQALLPLSGAAKSALEREVPKIVPLFSPRSARQFAHEAGLVSNLHLVAISDAVLAETTQLPAASRCVACTANGQSLAQELRNVLRRVEKGDVPH